ncbi:recombinase family protein [Sulfitobacter sp. JL08]|nr:recombinase family protein [Sulfitobacter sp. JL08]
MLGDIGTGRIDMVVVYKIDRLTRSLADFAKLVDQLDAAGCSFVSVTQAFNTSSSMGRLTLNVLLSFAQFEREVTAERIRDKIAASKKKGLWMGGVPPLGYDPHPDRTRRELVLNEGEAVTVRRLFALYQELGCLNAVTRQADVEGLRSKHHVFKTSREQGNRPFSRGQIYHVLRNPTYLGRIRHKDRSFPGLHAATIDQALWDRVQAKLEATAMRKRGSKTANGPHPHALNAEAPLLGKLRDETGDILTPSHTKKGNRRHRYYVSNRLVSGKPDPAGWRLPAKAFEAAVACAIQDSLTRAAERHEVIVAKDVVVLQDASARAHSLAARIEHEGIRQAAPLIDSGTIRKDRLGITLCAAALSNALELQEGEPAPALLRIKAPFHCRRRGAEMKIIAGSFQPVPDKTMIRALRNAHAWVRHMKAGASIREVMMQANKSDSYVSRIMLLAFLAPRIQKAIIDGTQPVSLTLETLIRSRMPRDWNAQEVLFGFDAKS